MWWVVSQSECSLAVPKRATLSAAVSECSTEVGRRGPVPCCGCERIDDCSRIVSEKVFGQRHVIRPIAAVLAYGEEVGQLQTGPLAQSDQVDGLAPFRPFQHAMAVVDDQLRVHGVESLHVIDASVMPAVTSTNTNAPTIMIAEKGAAIIKGAARQRFAA